MPRVYAVLPTVALAVLSGCAQSPIKEDPRDRGMPSPVVQAEPEAAWQAARQSASQGKDPRKCELPYGPDGIPWGLSYDELVGRTASPSQQIFKIPRDQKVFGLPAQVKPHFDLDRLAAVEIQLHPGLMRLYVRDCLQKLLGEPQHEGKNLIFQTAKSRVALKWWDFELIYGVADPALLPPGRPPQAVVASEAPEALATEKLPPPQPWVERASNGVFGIEWGVGISDFFEQFKGSIRSVDRRRQVTYLSAELPGLPGCGADFVFYNGYLAAIEMETPRSEETRLIAMLKKDLALADKEQGSNWLIDTASTVGDIEGSKGGYNSVAWMRLFAKSFGEWHRTPGGTRLPLNAPDWMRDPNLVPQAPDWVAQAGGSYRGLAFGSQVHDVLQKLKKQGRDIERIYYFPPDGLVQAATSFKVGLRPQPANLSFDQGYLQKIEINLRAMNDEQLREVVAALSAKYGKAQPLSDGSLLFAKNGLEIVFEHGGSRLVYSPAKPKVDYRKLLKNQL